MYENLKAKVGLCVLSMRTDGQSYEALEANDLQSHKEATKAFGAFAVHDDLPFLNNTYFTPLVLKCNICDEKTKQLSNFLHFFCNIMFAYLNAELF